MRTSSRVSLSTYQICTCERTSSVEPYRFFMRRAPAATPRTRPDVRPRKLTRRSASPSGNVFRMMASVSRAGMSSRRADAAPDQLPHSVRSARTRRAIVITTRASIAQCSRERILKKQSGMRGEFENRVFRDLHPGPTAALRAKDCADCGCEFILLTKGSCISTLSDARNPIPALFISVVFRYSAADLLHVHPPQGPQPVTDLSFRQHHVDPCQHRGVHLLARPRGYAPAPRL